MCISGVRRTAPSDTMVMCWVVESTLATPDQGEHVLYLVKHNGNPIGGGDITTRSISQPNFSSYPTRMLDGRANGMAPIECYSATLTMADWPVGTLYVEAAAFGHDGTAKLLETIVIHNDKDGVNRSPANKQIHCDVDNGSDSNSGADSENAVATLGHAINLARAGSGGDPNNCGGSTIYLYGDVVGNGGGSPGSWHTGPLHWLTIQCMPGSTWTRINPPFSTGLGSGGPSDFITCTGTGVGTFCRVRVQGYDVRGCGPIFYASNDLSGQPTVHVEVWREGGQHGSSYYGSGISVLCLADDEGCFNIGPHISSNSTIHRSFCTGELRLGSRIAYSAEDLIYDCEVHGTLGGATYIQSEYQNACCHSIVAHEHTYGRNVTPGWICNQADGFLPLDQLEVQKIGSTMRVLGPSAGTPIPFSTQAAILVGAPASIGVFFSGFANGANNGTFAVTGSGTTGGRHYIDVANALCVAEGPTAGALLETAFNGTRYNVIVHTSYISFGTSRTGEDIFRDIAHYDIDDETQGAFANGASHNNLLIDNVRGAGGFSNINLSANFEVGDPDEAITNCLIRRCSWPASTLLVHPSRIDYTGTKIDNCVFGTISADVAGAITRGLALSYCHAVNTPVYGTNGSTGTWLAGDPTETPYSMEPTTGNKGTGDPRMQNVADWAYHPTVSTKGVTRAVSELDWLLTTDDIDGAGAVTASASVLGAGLVGVLGAGAVTASASVAGAGLVGVLGAGAVTSGAVVAGTGFLGVQVPTQGVATFSPFQGGASVSGMSPVTPSDTEDLPDLSGSIHVASAGAVSVRFADGTDLVLVVPSGVTLPLRVRRVNATGTTAAGISTSR